MATSIARASHVRPWLFSAILFGVLVTGCSGGGSDSSIGQPGNGNPSPGPGTVPDGAATDTNIMLEWDASPDPVDGYIVLYGPTPETATNPLTELQSPEALSYSLNAGTHLGLSHGDRVCFRLRAYVGAQRSEPSVAECADI